MAAIGTDCASKAIRITSILDCDSMSMSIDAQPVLGSVNYKISRYKPPAQSYERRRQVAHPFLNIDSVITATLH